MKKNSTEQSHIFLLQTYSLKKTSTRLKVLSILSNAEIPLSVEKIQTQSRSENLATLYRTLELFEKVGLINKVQLFGRHTFYELIDEDHHHHHLSCKKCGILEDIEIDTPYTLERLALKKSKSFSSITNHSLEFFGMCKKCALGV